MEPSLPATRRDAAEAAVAEWGVVAVWEAVEGWAEEWVEE